MQSGFNLEEKLASTEHRRRPAIKSLKAGFIFAPTIPPPPLFLPATGMPVAMPCPAVCVSVQHDDIYDPAPPAPPPPPPPPPRTIPLRFLRAKGA